MNTQFFLDILAHRRLATKLAGMQRAWRQTRITGRVRGGLVFLMLLGVMFSGSPPIVTQAAENPIVLENQQAGSNGWLWTTLGNDIAQQIKAYASATSVAQGGTINFYVTVNPAQTYTVD